MHADIFWLGVKDHWDVWHLKRMLGPDSVLLDVGANLGYYAIHLASRLGPACRVWAFEPFPANFRRLETNIALNRLESQVTACPLGLSDQQREGHMHMREGNSGSANRLRQNVDLPLGEAVWA